MSMSCLLGEPCVALLFMLDPEARKDDKNIDSAGDSGVSLQPNVQKAASST